MGSGLLCRQVERADYLGGSEELTPLYPEIRDRRIAELAGLSTRQIVELNVEQLDAIKVFDQTLPTSIRGGIVRVVRAGLSFESGCILAPRGGKRMYQERPDVDPVSECCELADGMDTKYIINFHQLVDQGLVDPIKEIPVGAKTEIVTPLDPRLYTEEERKTIARETVDAMEAVGLISEHNHRFGPDVNMRPIDMANMRDRYIELGSDPDIANSVFTGTPVGDGGIAGRAEATALGGAVVLDEYLRRLQVEPKTVIRFSMQGFGNAGAPFVGRFNDISDYRGILVSVSDETGTFVCPRGISNSILRDLILSTDNSGTTRYVGLGEAAAKYQEIFPMATDIKFIPINQNSNAWLEVEADCYVPAAMARGINGQNVEILCKRMEKNRDDQIFLYPLANHGVDSVAQIKAERAGMRTIHHAHANGYGVVGSLASTQLALHDFLSEARHDPVHLERLIQKIARDVTRCLFNSSRRTLENGLPTGVSMPMAVEARRYQELALRYS